MNLHSPFFHLVIMRDHVFRLKRTRLAAFCIFRRSSEKHVSGTVQRSFAGIFQNGDDEADTDDLHGDIIADAEGRTSDRDQEQRAACDAGSTTCTDGRYDAEQECGRQIDIDAQRICSGQRQHGDRNGCAGHIDRRTERNGDRKDIRIQPESLAECQIHRDIGRRASGEEGIHAAFTDRGEDQRVWIHVNARKYDDRIHHKSDQEVRTDEDRQKLYIADERFHAGSADGVSDKTHDAERGKVDDPGHHLGDGLGNIIEPALGGAGCDILHRDTDDDRPCQDADVVRREQCIHRIIDDAQDQVMKHLNDAAWRSELRVSSHLQVQCGREQKGHADPDERCEECRHHIEADDRLHAAVSIFFSLRHGVHDQEENQDRCDTLQGFDEKITENLHDGDGRWEADSDQDADHQTDRDLLDQCHAGKRMLDRFEHNNSSS